MIASAVEFQAMTALVSRMLLNGTTASPEECQALKIDYDAVSSLYNQASVRHMKREAKRGVDAMLLSDLGHLTLRDYHEAYSVATVDLPMLAKKYKVGGYKLARLYLEVKFGRTTTLAHFLDNPSIIEDRVTREDLLACMASDPFCSHPCEQLKECVGKEFEEYLICRLHEKRMCFETEAELRCKGKPKTPDILFLIPMATPDCNEPSRGLAVVNWIDSKAMFADEETLAEHLEQLRGYANRYGRGLVIYWHGYVADIKSSHVFQAADDMILLSNKFPEQWMGLDGKSPTDALFPL